MILDLIVLAVIILFAVVGAKKGFIGALLGFINKFVSLAIALLFAKPFAKLLGATPLADFAANITEGIANSALSSILTVEDLHLVLTEYMLILFSFIILFILAFIGMKLLRSLADAITSLPVLKQVNNLLGFALGVLEALILIFILLGILSLFNNGTMLSGLFAQIDSSYITKFLYDNNFVVNILFNFDPSMLEEVKTAVIVD